MTYSFRLQRADGSPADPPTYRSTVVTGAKATRSRWAQTKPCACSASATTTPTSRPFWSLRTCPDPPLAPRADVP